MGGGRITARILVTVLLLGTTAVPHAAARQRGCEAPTGGIRSSARILCGLHHQGSLTVSKEAGLGRMAIGPKKKAAVLRREEGIVTLLDLRRPRSPRVMGHYDDGAQDSLDGDVVFSHDGRYLFYARQTANFSKEGIHVLDVSDPRSPALVSYAVAGGSLRVGYHRAGDEEWVVVLDAITGLVVYRFERNSGQLIPVHVDAMPALKVGGPVSAGIAFDKDPATKKTLMYVTTGKTGLQIFDFSDPSFPVEIGTWAEEPGLGALAVDTAKGRRDVYVATEYWFNRSRQPQVIRLDARKLGSIKKTDTLALKVPPDDRWRIQQVEVIKGEVFVAHSHAGLVVFDRKGRVSRVARIPGRSVLAPPVVAPSAYGLGVSGRRIYLTDSAAGTVNVLAR